jgi:hypothetical protein
MNISMKRLSLQTPRIKMHHAAPLMKTIAWSFPDKLFCSVIFFCSVLLLLLLFFFMINGFFYSDAVELMQGDGTREGTGKCSCNSGYNGTLCSECASGFFEESRNDTHVVCRSESLVNSLQFLLTSNWVLFLFCH